MISWYYFELRDISSTSATLRKYTVNIAQHNYFKKSILINMRQVCTSVTDLLRDIILRFYVEQHFTEVLFHIIIYN